MKRIRIGTVAALLAAVLLFPVQVGAISAQSGILVDAATGRVLYEKDPDSPSLIASTTKIMTALVICERCNVLDRVKIPKQAVGIEGSSIYLREGEVLTVQELLYGLMLHSGNDAAVALAIYCGGTVEGFVEMMNDKAHLLGMDSTHFANPNGLDHPEHYSTARDLATLASYAMDNPIFAQTVSTKTISLAGRSLRNHNKLLWQVEGADGVKTGFTKASGRVLVSSATRDGRRLVAVTINDPNDWQDHRTLLEDGFSRFQLRHLIAQGDCLGVAEVPGGLEACVELLASEDFFYPMAQEEQIQVLLPGSGLVYAPVAQGQDAGFAHICIDGKSIGKVRIQYGATVEQEPEKSFWDRMFGR